MGIICLAAGTKSILRAVLYHYDDIMVAVPWKNSACTSRRPHLHSLFSIEGGKSSFNGRYSTTRQNRKAGVSYQCTVQPHIAGEHSDHHDNAMLDLGVDSGISSMTVYTHLLATPMLDCEY